MAPEVSSLVGGGEIDVREIESIQRIFAECLAEDNPRANLHEEIITVVEEVPCLVEKRCCVSSRDEENSFRNKNNIKRKKMVTSVSQELIVDLGDVQTHK